MAQTLQNLLDDARVILQDTVEPYRYSNQELLNYVNGAVREIRRNRPDFFYGTFSTALPLYTVDQLATEWPFELFYVPTYEFIAGSAELRDDEFAQDGRAIALRTSFVQKIGGMA